MSKSKEPILREYVRYLNSVLNKLITDARLIGIYDRPSPLSTISCFQKKEFCQLQLKPVGWLDIRQIISIPSNSIVVETSRYIYYPSSAMDEDNWLFRYEYNRSPKEGVPRSHLHVNMLNGGKPFKKTHFPTGRMSIEQIIAHLIIEHGVKPLRTDWLEHLIESHTGFMLRRTDLKEPYFL